MYEFAIQRNSPEADKTSLKKLLFEKEAETLTGLADLKQDTKDFKARMISAERDKMLLIKSLYLLAQSLLPKLNLSHQNVQYYASLVDYCTTYDLRKELKSEQTNKRVATSFKLISIVLCVDILITVLSEFGK